jgi:hypothetical protein
MLMKNPFEFYTNTKANLEKEAAILKFKFVHLSLLRFAVFLGTCFLIYSSFGKFPNVFIIAFVGLLVFGFLVSK